MDILTLFSFFHIKAHIAALMGLVSALVVAVWGFTMPADAAVASALYGACYGLFPIGWIILNVISWIIFVGVCIDAGGVFTNTIYSIFFK